MTRVTRLIDPAGLSAFRSAPLSRGRVHLALDAPGAALLFVHGGYHGAWCWQRFMPWFAARGHACAAVDLRGHGGLPQGPDFIRQGVADLAEDVVEAARMIGRPVVTVGHSLGALVAMTAAREARPVGQILLAPSPPGQLENLKPLPTYPEDRPVAPPGPETARDKFLAGHDGEIDSFMERLCPESPRAMNDRYGLRIHVDPGWVGGGTLCLSAGRDLGHLHPPGQDEAAARFFGGRHVTRPLSAHDMMLDDHWEETAGILLDWLQESRPGEKAGD